MASTVFKIQSTSDYFALSKEQLSFRKGQAFYALSKDSEGFYFVSTQYSTPFARTAINGLVPASHFLVSDRFGHPEVKVSKPAVQPIPPTRHASRPVKVVTPVSGKSLCASDLINASIINKTPVSSNAELNYKQQDTYSIRVYRKTGSHTVSRTFSDVIKMDTDLSSEFPAEYARFGMSRVIKDQQMLASTKKEYQAASIYIDNFFKHVPRYVIEESTAVARFFASQSSFESSQSTVGVKQHAQADVRFSSASRKLQQLLGRFSSI